MSNNEEKTIVLVADDDERVVQDVSSTLEKAGLTVIAAPDITAAVGMCNSPGSIDLAIIDAALPGYSLATIDQIYRSQPGIRVLLTSSEGSPEPAGLKSGRTGRSLGWLRKPFRRSHLLGSVLQALDTPLAFTA